MHEKFTFAVVIMVSTLFLCWVGCSRDAAIRNSVDAARAVCCLSHIRAGKTPEGAEAACATLNAVAPYIVPAEQAAASKEVVDSGPGDAGQAD